MTLTLFAPELVLIAAALLLFFVSASSGRGEYARGIALYAALAAALASAITLYAHGSLFYQTYRVDLFSQSMKLVISLGFMAVMLFAGRLKGVAEAVRPEYYFFLTLSVLGLVMLVSCVELLTMFIALELSSYSLYLLVPMRDDSKGLRAQMEGAIKYILFGVAATGVMLYGMSYLYGLTGTTYFNQLIPALTGMTGSLAAMVALAMVLCGFFFKLAVFPFHFWVPDVYQGASNETTAFIASVPKVAAVAMLIRVCAMASPQQGDLTTLLVVFSAASMFYGNLVALVQTDIKRMLGFSGIAHAGYVMLGFVVLKDTGYATALYYIAAYLMMNLAAFLVVCTVSADGENVRVSDMGGLHKRSPLLAFILAVSMFALAGLPPFAGFMGKFMLLTGAYKAGHVWLVILAAINTAISIYYYLSVVRVAYTNPVTGSAALEASGLVKALGVALVAVIIALGVAPDAVLRACAGAVRAVL
jgi:NADH-quinone oxidoreductase subunit N